MATVFETETCSRCGGSGHYSYCQMYGTVCFKCGGSGKYYTKRGGVAHDYYVRLNTRSIAELKVGDYIRDNGKNRAIIEIDLEKRIVRTSNCTFQDHTEFRVIPTREQNEEYKAKALAYQATLTKAGKPYKNIKSEVTA